MESVTEKTRSREQGCLTSQHDAPACCASIDQSVHHIILCSPDAVHVQSDQTKAFYLQFESEDFVLIRTKVGTERQDVVHSLSYILYSPIEISIAIIISNES